MRWLITAFEPFAGASTNSSFQLLCALKKSSQDRFPDVEFLQCPLPVSYKRAWHTLKEIILASPVPLNGILCLGQAESRMKLGLETTAVNLRDGTLSDNDLITFTNHPILSQGPIKIQSPIQWEHFQISSGGQIEISNDAGRFVCNSVMYELFHWANSTQKWAGFVHVPLLDDAHMPSDLALNEMNKILDFLVKLPRRRLEVSAGIILNPIGEVLLARRPPGKSFEGQWELPGGKIEVGESSRSALAREIEEELGLKIGITDDFGIFPFDYDALSINLHVHLAVPLDQPREGGETHEFKWIDPFKIDTKSLLPADILPIQTYLKSRI